MILRFLLFTSFLLLLNLCSINGALNVAKLNSNHQNQQQHGIVVGESKQHRHSMDQLEPDLAQTIFGGIQRNPLERTTTAKPKNIAIIKSPTLRGKRDTLPEIKLADVKILGNDDSLPEHSHKADVEYENINADFNEDKKSEAVESATAVDLIIDETANLSDGTTENGKEKVIDSELAVVTSGPQEGIATTPSSPTSTAGRSGGILVQEVAPPTPKYNLTQNDNSPTENLDRKILAFEINDHNKRIFQELQKKKAAAIAAKKIEDPEFDVEITEAPTTAALPTTTPVPAANEVKIDESKKLLNEVDFKGLAKSVVKTEAPLNALSVAPSSAPKEEIVQENAKVPEPIVQENVQTAEIPQPAEAPLIDKANIEPVPTLTAELQPTPAPAEIIDNEAQPVATSVEAAPSAVEDVASLPEDPHKHQTEVSPATPFTEAGSLSKEVFLPVTTPQPTAGSDLILPDISEAAARQAALQAEANAAKVGSIEFPSKLPSIFYQRPSQKKPKPAKPEIQQQPEQPPPPPPTDDELPGFLLPHRPILDSTVTKGRHLISNYIDPIRLQKAAAKHQKEEFFRRSAVIARERSKREEKTEQQHVAYDDDIIDEKDSGESNLIERLTTTDGDENSTTATIPIAETIKFGEASREEATTLATTTATMHKLKLVPKKSGATILDDQVQKATGIHENQESTTGTISISETPDITERVTAEETTPQPSTTTTPSKELLIAKALTREEKLALLESFHPRPGTNLGKTHTLKKPVIEPVDASAEPQDPENPWTHRFKSHIQLKLTDESREVVDRTQLKILPKLISPEVLKAQKKAELEAKKKAEKEAKEAEFEFKDLPEPHSGDLKVDVDVVTKPTTKAATLIASTAAGMTTARPAQQQGQGGLPQSFFARSSQQIQQQQVQQGFQQQQIFQQQPQQQQFIPQSQPQAPYRIIIVDGVRYVLREPPQQFFQQPQQLQQQQFQQQQPQQQAFQPQHFEQQPRQQQFFQQPQVPSAGAAPPSHSPSSTPPVSNPQRIIHSGSAKQLTTTLSSTPSTGPRVNPEDLSVVRIFQHRGTTRQIFATTPAPTTRASTTTLPPTPETTQWIPVTFTTHPTPTTPFDISLITTVKPIARSRVRTHHQDFDVYDEVERSAATVLPKKSQKIRKTTTPKTIESADFEDPIISEVNLSPEQSFRDIPLKHPPRDPPPPSFDYSDADLIAKRKPSTRKPPKLVRLNSGPSSAAAIPQKPTDFIGDTPTAKADLRGLDKTIAFIS